MTLEDENAMDVVKDDYRDTSRETFGPDDFGRLLRSIQARSTDLVLRCSARTNASNKSAKRGMLAMRRYQKAGILRDMQQLSGMVLAYQEVCQQTLPQPALQRYDEALRAVKVTV